jgi:hypothetical protein
MARPDDELPEWASEANYPAGAESWSGQPRIDDSNIESFAANGFTPEEEVNAEELNAYLARLHAWVDYAGNEILLGLFGDASDGDVVISSNTTIARDMYYDNLTVEAGFLLHTEGFRVFVRDTLTVEATATLGAPGNDGEDGDDGSGGAGGAGWSDGTVAGAVAGGAAEGTGTQAGTGVSSSLGGNGGDSGASDGGSDGASGGAITAPLAESGGQLRDVLQAIKARGVNTDTLEIRGGGGGAGGGSTGGGDRGGGGGGGGGVAVIVARHIINNGTISCAGGAGGDAIGTPPSIGGGGGGGGGGLVVLIYRSYSGSGTISVAGGLGGSDNGVGGDQGDDGTIRQFTV